ncbi:unnamed protein product [Cuscuta epithymum]|uniref:Uncharacterized protein n=1 Tax=Cuscuta epithymum TaxID=186058 RepID=A0AAV0GHP7_9ASTE|nr:unnamed protein product [Cuscuta epithymum]CAH9147483.1 unnamed protein product [Cuscuta epithymum]
MRMFSDGIVNLLILVTTIVYCSYSSYISSWQTRKLIAFATSSSVISTAAILLSILNKEAADQRDLHNLFIISNVKIIDVQMKNSILITQPVFVSTLHIFTSF